jgi:hypothetical protein
LESSVSVLGSVSLLSWSVTDAAKMVTLHCSPLMKLTLGIIV